MKRRFLLPIACLLLLLLPPAARGDGGDCTAAPALSFDENGYFTVLVLSDAQDTQWTVPYLPLGIAAALDAHTPDLVVLLGDQLEGGSPLMRVGDRQKHVERAIANLLAPIVERALPFAVVFGNHDAESGVSNERQLAIYQRYPGCVSVDVDESGAYRVPVTGADGTEKLSLYLFDSGAYTEDGGYGCVSRAQVEWYLAQSSALRATNNGARIPAVAFQHIVVGEIYDALTEVGADAPGAFAGVGSGQGAFYSPDAASLVMGALREAPCPSAENNGQFEAFLAQGEVFACFFGHDHINDYIISHRGVDLVACPGATYTSYNERSVRGVRMLRFSEDNVRSYDTLLVPFASYENVSFLGVVPYYLMTTTRVPNAAKLLVLLVLLLAAAVLLTVLLLKKRGQVPAGDGAIPHGPPEFDD